VGKIRNATKITKKVYEKVLDRDKSCRICGGNSWLVCHHIIPRSRLGVGVEENLIMLCNFCHLICHQDMKKWTNKLLQSQELIYGTIDIEQLKYNKRRNV